MSSGTSWTRRQGSQYRRMCARPGCGAVAAATLRFQPTLRQAWLVDLDETAARTQGDLCHRHATTLVLPRGWELHDDRTGAAARPGEAAVATPADAPAPRRVRVRRRKPAVPVDDPAGRLPGFEAEVVVSNGRTAAVVAEAADEAEVAVAVEPAGIADAGDAAPDDVPEIEVAEAEERDSATEADEAAPARARPAQFGSNDDDEVDERALNAVLDARTPLLQRAFRNAQPRG